MARDLLTPSRFSGRASICRFCGGPDADLVDPLGRYECADTVECQKREIVGGRRPHAAEYAKGPVGDPDGPLCACGLRVFDPIHRDGWAPVVRAERDARRSQTTPRDEHEILTGDQSQTVIGESLVGGQASPLHWPADIFDRAEAACEASVAESAAVTTLVDPGRLGLSVGSKLRTNQFDAPAAMLSAATDLMTADTVLARMTVELQQGITAARRSGAGRPDIAALLEVVTLQTQRVRAMRSEFDKVL